MLTCMAHSSGKTSTMEEINTKKPSKTLSSQVIYESLMHQFEFPVFILINLEREVNFVRIFGWFSLYFTDQGHGFEGFRRVPSLHALRGSAGREAEEEPT